MSERYKVVEGSESAHCCFKATVVDTHPNSPFYDESNWVCECFDMESAQKIADAMNAAQQPAPDVTQLVEALEQIERWDGFPSTGEVWEDSGEPVSYGAAFGSNGERDFMRGVARKALAAYRKQGGEV